MENLFNVKCLVLASVVAVFYYLIVASTELLPEKSKLHLGEIVVLVLCFIVFFVSLWVVGSVYNKLYSCKKNKLYWVAAILIALVGLVAYYTSKWLFRKYPQYKDTEVAVVLSGDDDCTTPECILKRRSLLFRYYMKHMTTWVYIPFALGLLFYILMAWYDHFEECEWKMHWTPVSYPTKGLKPSDYIKPPKDHLKTFGKISAIFYSLLVAFTVGPVAILTYTN